MEVWRSLFHLLTGNTYFPGASQICRNIHLEKPGIWKILSFGYPVS
ncbi:hypothetical protein CKA32_005873 [Geitlerinema sp. FC II]|nr:hypothetical protein CKA32_005873 [Geitlerinema sp. FC II]